MQSFHLILYQKTYINLLYLERHKYRFGNIYTWTDGLAMGSPLNPTLSNFYMTHAESSVFNNFAKPSIYANILTIFSH